MTLNIENMVCDRCIMVVDSLLRRLGYTVSSVTLGSAQIAESLDSDALASLAGELHNLGFELIEDAAKLTAQKVKTLLIGLARSGSGTRLKLSAWLEERTGVDYRTLVSAFSAVEGRTIENYFISQKIEYVKELLDYGRLTASEIAYRTGYSSVAHLSRQFRAVTGMTVTQYRLGNFYRFFCSF